MIKEIVTDTFFLSQKSEPATEADTAAAHDLLDTIKANAERCVGLAANMTGVRKTILAALIGREYVIMINPVIVSRSPMSYEAEEGCLSLTGVRKAVRYRVITVEYLDIDFRPRKKTLRGFEAQIVQHEIDHFSGILI